VVTPRRTHPPTVDVVHITPVNRMPVYGAKSILFQHFPPLDEAVVRRPRYDAALN